MGKEQQSDAVKQIHRDFFIKDQFSEVNHQKQNPVESVAIRWLKNASHVLLDRTGAPDSAWFFAIQAF